VSRPCWRLVAGCNWTPRRVRAGSAALSVLHRLLARASMRAARFAAQQRNAAITARAPRASRHLLHDSTARNFCCRWGQREKARRANQTGGKLWNYMRRRLIPHRNAAFTALILSSECRTENARDRLASLQHAELPNADAKAPPRDRRTLKLQ
jgi:hypothetical protein